MRIIVRLFASLPRYVPGAKAAVPIEVELPEQATVAELIGCLSLPPSEAQVVFVNGRARPEDWRLEPGDQVGIFPPIGGG